MPRDRLRFGATTPRALLTFTLVLTLVGGCQGGPRRAQPNILLIITDDQAWSHFTPELMPTVFREIVDRGELFTRAYVDTPLCCPSRASILTGLQPSKHGVFLNTDPLRKPTIVDALHQAGYSTMLAGKYLNSWPCTPRPEFDRWVCVGEGESTYSQVDPMVNIDGEWDQHPGYTSEILTDQALRFADGGFFKPDPWFILYTPTAPHIPADDPRYASLPVAKHRPPSYDEDTSDKPSYANTPPMSRGEKLLYDSLWENVVRTTRALDDSIGRLLAVADEETYVIFLSDNGYLFGEHGRTGKEAPYEESLRVPFAVRFPGVDAGTSSDALVMNEDVAATIAEIAGVPIQADGRSLIPLVRGDLPEFRSVVLSSYCQGDLSLCPEGLSYQGYAYKGYDEVPPAWWAIVTSRWKYVEYGTGEEELYDLVNDPYEMTNKASNPGLAPLKEALAAQLAALRPG